MRDTMIDTMGDTKHDTMIDWVNLQKYSGRFKTQKPFRFAYIRNFLAKPFYDSLYKSYPEIDHTWQLENSVGSLKYSKTWNHTMSKDHIPKLSGFEKDHTISVHWRGLLSYLNNPDFAANFAKFSGLDLTHVKYAGFTAYKKGGFHIPHIHNNGPNCLIMLFYFNESWPKGEGGATYVSKKADESTILFEPDSLDNTCMIFQDGPRAAHGVRYITKDLTRRAFQLEIQHYDHTHGWSGK